MFGKLKGKRVMVVDDNLEICEIIKLYAQKIEMKVKSFTDPLLVHNELENNFYDVIILDVSMPKKDGFELLEDIKKFNIPVLFLSAKAHENDKVKGLVLGAEDYITKPFSLEELFLKVQIIVDRKENYTYVKGDLLFDLEKQKLYYKDVEIKVAQKSFLILLYLAKRENTIISREELLKEIWGFEDYLDDRMVDGHIKEIRKLINKDIIKTKRSEGYMYENN